MFTQDRREDDDCHGGVCPRRWHRKSAVPFHGPIITRVLKRLLISSRIRTAWTEPRERAEDCPVALAFEAFRTTCQSLQDMTRRSIVPSSRDRQLGGTEDRRYSHKSAGRAFAFLIHVWQSAMFSEHLRSRMPHTSSRQEMPELRMSRPTSAKKAVLDPTYRRVLGICASSCALRARSA